jgi:putative flippase GtrA
MIVLGLDRYSGRVISYLCAASFTWAGNRMVTFAESRAHGARAVTAEWLRFLVTNLAGGAVNYAVYALLVTVSATVHEYPVLGVAAGALSGMTVNYFASRRLVFTAGR